MGFSFPTILPSLLTPILCRLPERSVLCRTCCWPVASSCQLINAPLSPASVGDQDFTGLFGTAQPLNGLKLRTPEGRDFCVVAFHKAECRGTGSWSGQPSLFPGFIWREVVCHLCGKSMGWMFVVEGFMELEDLFEFEDNLSEMLAKEHFFYCLILDRIIGSLDLPDRRASTDTVFSLRICSLTQHSQESF